MQPAPIAHSGAVPWVYIVECRDGSFYVGSTYDLERRISEHNEGLGATYTRRRRPVVLRWSAHYERVEDAYAMEKKLQSLGASQTSGADRRGRRGSARSGFAQLGGEARTAGGLIAQRVS